MAEVNQSLGYSSTTGSRPSPKLDHVSYPKWFGGSASCMAVIVSHPLDLVKVRMQMVTGTSRPGTINTALRIIRSEGVKGLYNGLSAGLTRQLTYGSVRIGLYESLKQNAEQEHIPLKPPVLALMAGVSGFVGAMFGNPSDIANIRMQNDRSLPEHARRNYRHVFDAWVQMKRHESWTVFWQGLWPNCFRCGLMTMCQLGSYDYFKSMLMKMTGSLGEHSAIHLSASLLASLVATTLCSPIDVVKTQLMGSSQQGSAIRAVQDLTTTHGPRWIFRGWMPSFIRMGPQTVMTLVLLEQHKRIYRIITQRQ